MMNGNKWGDVGVWESEVSTKNGKNRYGDACKI